MKTIVFNGLSGQVGGAISAQSKVITDYKWISLTSQECNLLDTVAIEKVFAEHNPDYFLHVAAYTAVDKAEEDQDNCFAINAEATKRIAELCEQHNTTLLYVSSDYVYHSIEGTPLKETDPCDPKGIYAKSKYQGEQYIREVVDKHIILRTSWVYAKEGHNFVNTMVRLGEGRDLLTIVGDQTGAPTYAPDIATALIKAVQTIEDGNEVFGTYNFANGGATNWANFAKEIFAIKDITCEVKEITTAEFGAAAPRPQWSVMNTHKFKTAFDTDIRTWQACLKECLAG